MIIIIILIKSQFLNLEKCIITTDSNLENINIVFKTIDIINYNSYAVETCYLLHIHLIFGAKKFPLMIVIFKIYIMFENNPYDIYSADSRERMRIIFNLKKIVLKSRLNRIRLL